MADSEAGKRIFNHHMARATDVLAAASPERVASMLEQDIRHVHWSHPMNNHGDSAELANSIDGDNVYRLKQAEHRMVAFGKANEQTHRHPGVHCFVARRFAIGLVTMNKLIQDVQGATTERNTASRNAEDIRKVSLSLLRPTINWCGRRQRESRQLVPRPGRVQRDPCASWHTIEIWFFVVSLLVQLMFGVFVLLNATSNCRNGDFRVVGGPLAVLMLGYVSDLRTILSLWREHEAADDELAGNDEFRAVKQRWTGLALCCAGVRIIPVVLVYWLESTDGEAAHIGWGIFSIFVLTMLVEVLNLAVSRINWNRVEVFDDWSAKLITSSPSITADAANMV